MKMKHAFGPIILACIIFMVILLIPSKHLVSLISNEKVEDAATSLQKEKIILKKLCIYGLVLIN